MRITHHGNDLLVTDQSLGLGAFLLTIGVVLLVTALSRMADGLFLSLATAFYTLAAVFCIRGGLVRLVATQLIVDPDEKLVITKHWALRGTNVQRIPFDAVQGFSIEPEGEQNKTSLVIKTTRGPVAASAGTKAVRAAWEEVVSAVERHMGR